MRGVLKKQKDKVSEKTLNSVQKPNMPTYVATPTFTKSGFIEGKSEEINVNIMSDNRYCAFLATTSGKRIAYTVFDSKEELETKMNIQLI